MLASFKKYELHIFSLFYWIASSYILFYFNGTGGEADSIYHYLFSKYSVNHPALLLDHWAKPIFTLFAAPFAQFGFIGMKFFNAVCVFLASIIVYKIAKGLKLNYPVLAPLFYFIFPISFTTTFSGFTEPLCAFALSASIYLFQQKKYLLTALLISFTPFIRSEGLIFIGIFGLLFIYLKQWKAFYSLSFGHLFYTLVGILSGQELLWVFTKIPYAYLSSHYGSGSLFHFAEKLNYLMGIPLLVLFILGLIYWVFNKKAQNTETLLLVGLFIGFFTAHSLFWYLEIFNSMGLKRVFAAVTPLMAILCLYGFNWLSKIENKKLRVGLSSIIIILVVIFPFTKNPAAIDWNDLKRTEAQENAVEVAKYIASLNLNTNRYIYTDPYLGEALGIDPFDENKHMILATEKRSSPVNVFIVIENYKFTFKPEKYKSAIVVAPQIFPNDLIIWDNWHSVIDYAVPDKLLAHLTPLKEFKKGNSIYKVYKKEG